MNIILINDFAFVNGGAGQVAFNTAKILAKSGDKVIVFTAVGPVAEDLQKIENLEIICLNQYDILHDPVRLRAIVQGLWNFKASREFAALLKRFTPQNTVIHIHSISKAISASILPIAKKYGFKVLYHLHDYGIVCPNLGFYNYPKGEICNCKALSWRCLVKNCDSRSYFHKYWRIVRQYVYKYMGDWRKNIDCYIYISEFSLNILRPYLQSDFCLRYLPNVIDIMKKPRIEVENNNLIVYIGRLSPEKNPQILAKVTNDLDLPVLFIGSGVCEQKIRDINPKAEITGWLSYERIDELLKKARILVFPSKWYETQGLTVPESMARGIPCIVSDTCAARDMIINGKNGLLFSSDDEKSLSDSLRILLDNKKLEGMSRNAYEIFWSQNYNADKYLKSLKGIYYSALQDDGKKRL